MARLTLDETKEVKVLLNQIRAFESTVDSILNNEKAVEHSRYASYLDMARIYNDLANQVKKVLKISTMLYTFETEKMQGYTSTLWGQQKIILEQVLITTRMLRASVEGSADFADDEFDNLENFLKSKLRTAMFEIPEKELQVQNAIETLLLGRGMNKGTDYDRESGKVEFSGKEYIPDFVIPKMNLCIEVKLMRNDKKSKIIEEISSDITAYGKVYERQLFVVYDLGVIQNEDEFKHDIENIGNIKVVVVKH